MATSFTLSPSALMSSQNIKHRRVILLSLCQQKIVSVFNNSALLVIFDKFLLSLLDVSLTILWRNWWLDRWCVPPLQWISVELLNPISIMYLLMCLALYKYYKKKNNSKKSFRTYKYYKIKKRPIQRKASKLIFIFLSDIIYLIDHHFWIIIKRCHLTNRSPFSNQNKDVIYVIDHHFLIIYLFKRNVVITISQLLSLYHVIINNWSNKSSSSVLYLNPFHRIKIQHIILSQHICHKLI